MEVYIASSKPYNGRPIKTGKFDFDKKTGVQIYVGDVKELGCRIKMSYRDAETFCKNFAAREIDVEKQEDESMVGTIRRILLNPKY